ncbi:MAG: hypothetical protein IJ568_03860 [Bacilli bacterium]|nr:hypothetical protein [Bacilli bacterium]
MAVTSKFLIVKNKDSKEIKYFDYDKLDGYNLTTKKDVHFIDAIDVNRVIIINPTFIDKIATKKINNKFSKLINMMQYVCEREDDETGDGYEIALNEAEKLKVELRTKYRKLLNEEKLELMIKKIEILEDELKLRLEILAKKIEKEEELSHGHSR